LERIGPEQLHLGREGEEEGRERTAVVEANERRRRRRRRRRRGWSVGMGRPREDQPRSDETRRERSMRLIKAD
jgi:hypothetical protein